MVLVSWETTRYNRIANASIQVQTLTNQRQRQEGRPKVLALILDSLGSTELLFILVIALVFFGPRKLPQLSRSLGKSIAEFRKASEDFKRTWEREVALESARANPAFPEETSTSDDHQTFQEPSVEPIPAEQVIARNASPEPVPAPVSHAAADETNPQPLSKREWL